MAATLKETIKVKEISPNTFEAQPFGRNARMGNRSPIAFGGIVLSQTISAGFMTVIGSDFQLFSVQGSYLGPASTDVRTVFNVQSVRDTSRFCTRVVTATQGEGSKQRNIFIAVMDWHRKEESLFEYSKPPICPSHPAAEDLPAYDEYIKTVLTKEEAQIYLQTFELSRRVLEIRPCPDSIGARSVLGTKTLDPWPTATPIHEHTYATRVRVPEVLDSHARQCGSLGFIMDMALSFLPLTFTNKPLTSAAAASSLDFSLRIFKPFDITQWHLHEQHTERGAEARTFSVGRMYDERGEEVACMTQMSILRPLARL